MGVKSSYVRNYQWLLPELGGYNGWSSGGAGSLENHYNQTRGGGAEEEEVLVVVVVVTEDGQGRVMKFRLQVVELVLVVTDLKDILLEFYPIAPALKAIELGHCYYGKIKPMVRIYKQ